LTNGLQVFLEDLEARGLTDNIIVFFFSDHGGCLPRGKEFPFESGLRVPYLVHVLKKWQEKYNIKQGIEDDRLIGFEDFAPTVLNLAEIDIPKSMQGKPFLGPNAVEKKYQFGFRTNQENYHYDPARTVSDKKYKYIGNYIPHKPYALRNLYQWGLPANLAWDAYVFSGECTNEDWLQPFQPKASEMLFDLDKDPGELNNLAADPAYATKLEELRTQVSAHIRKTEDLGFFFRGNRKKEGGLHQWVRETNFPLAELYKAVEIASMPSEKDIPFLEKVLASKYEDIRYWGAVGFNTLASRGQLKSVPKALKDAVNDPVSQISTMATEALCHVSDNPKEIDLLFERFSNNDNAAYSALETLTWYPAQKHKVVALGAELEKLLAENEVNKDDRMSVYLKIRSLLVNIGKLKVHDLYPDTHIAKGKKLNIKSRQFVHPAGIQTSVK